MKIDEKLWDGGWWNFFGCYIWWENGKKGKKYLNNMRIRRKSIENEGKKAISQHPEYYIIFFPFSVPYIFSFYIFEARIQETLTYFPCIKRNKIYFAPFYKICSSSVIKMARSCKILWISYVFILYSYFLLATVSLFLSLLLFLLLFLLYDSSNSGRFCIATGNNIAQKKRTKKQELILSFSLFLYNCLLLFC